MKKILPLCLLLWLSGGSVARCQPGVHNVQGIPTPTLFQGRRTSYDHFDKYTAGQYLNGLNAWDPVLPSLGCFFASAYYARQGYFGVLVDDPLTSYTPGANLAGLAGGDNWITVYVVHHPWAPSYAYDNLTNYSVSSSLDGLNGGADDGGSVTWAGPYVLDPCGVTAGPTVAAYKGAIVITLSAGTPGQYTTIYLTADGSTPNALASQGDINSATSWPPSGTWIYAGAFTIAGGGLVNLKAVQAGGGGACQSGVTSGSYRDFGQNWSNNVVVNGGANPSSGNVAILNNCGLQLNTNGLLEASLGAYPTIKQLNLFMPDNLTAARTPQIYWNGNQPWVNHNFVSGDLTVNGLAGDAASKYLEIGLNPSTDLGLNSSGIAIYAYTADSGAHDDLGEFQTGGGSFYIGSNQSGNAVDQIQTLDANKISVASPGNGYYCASRSANNREDLYFANNGTAHASIGNNTVVPPNSFANLAILAFALNVDGSPGVFSNCRLSAAAIIAAGYTSNDSKNLFNVLQSVRTQLGGGYR